MARSSFLGRSACSTSPDDVKVSPEDICSLLDAVDQQWSAASNVADNGAHHGYRQVTVVVGGHLEVPEFADVLEPFAPVRSAWLSRIEPGGYVLPHIDAGPYWERWQIPFTVSGALVHGDEVVAHEVGVPFRVRHYDWHEVRNIDGADRVSLVIDRAVPLTVPSGPFRLKHEERPCPS